MGQRNRELPTLYMLVIAQSVRFGELSAGQCGGKIGLKTKPWRKATI